MNRWFNISFKSYKFNVSKVLLGFSLGYFFYKNNNNIKFFSDNNIQNNVINNSKNNLEDNSLNSYETYDISEFKENIPKEIIIDHKNEKLKIIIIRKNNNFFALGGIDSFDFESLLKNGVVFGNKITSNSGSCYNIETGQSEIPPSYLNLPIFSTYVENNKLFIRIPNKVPKYIKPFVSKKENHDFRKIVIIGLSSAGIGCAETLRQMGYEGEITIVTSEINEATNKDLLTQYFNDKENNDFFYRKGDFEKDLDLDIVYGLKATNFYIRESNYYIELSNNRKIEFDALLIASGSNTKVKNYEGLKKNPNYMIIHNHFKHKMFIDKLNSINNPKIMILGYNFNSIESAANLKREYPNSDITLVNDCIKNDIRKLYGKEFDILIKNYLSTLGIKLEIHKKILRMKKDENNNINQVILKNGKTLETDLILDYPDYEKGNTNFIYDTKFAEDIELDKNYRIIVDEYLNTHRKRIFAAGSCASMPYEFIHKNQFISRKFSEGYLQGQISAYNILGLDVPFHFIPSQIIKAYTLELYKIGFHSYYDKLKVIGDIKTNNFMIVYGVNDKVVSAIGSLTYKNQLDIIQESLKQGIDTQFSSFSEEYVSNIYDKIIKINKSGCYKGEMYKIKDKFLDRKILWKDRNFIDDQLFEDSLENEDIKQNILKDEKIIQN